MRMKKIIAFKCCLFLTLGLIVCTMNASYAKIGDSGVIKANSEDKVTDLIAGAKLHQQDIGALKDCTGDYYYPYGSQYLESMPNHQGIKMVSWSYRNEDEFQMNGVTEIAENFEKLNPGWIVVGGTNADFFDINRHLSSGCMDSNAYEMGEMIHARNITVNETWRGIFGFKENSDMIVGIPEITNYYNMHVYTSSSMNEEKEVIKIASINPEVISETGITLITKDKNKYYDLRNYNVIEGKYDINRYTRYDQGYYFLKGTLNQVHQGLENDKPKDIITEDGKNINANQFYLVSKDDSVKKLELNTYVKIQKDYLGKYSEVENAVSYYWKILDQGTVLFEGHSNKDTLAKINEQYQGCNVDYITCSKSRCLFGVKADGSYVMAVIDGTTQMGLTLSEAAYYMKEIGCVDAWDFDGGGSATLIARDEFGFLKTINVPSDAGDGTERKVGNALLMVTRDSGFTTDFAKSTISSVTFEKNNNNFLVNNQNVKITVNGITKEVLNDQTKITFDNLQPSTKYVAKIDFTSDGKDYTTYLDATTQDYVPKYQIEANSYGFTITRTEELPGIKVLSTMINVDQKTYNMKDLTTFIIDDLSLDYIYEISFTVVAEITASKQQITYVSPKEKYATLAYEIPKITSFEESKKTESYLRLRYSYEDLNELVTKAYIMVNDKIFNLDSNSGTYKIEDLDFRLHSYYISLVLEYTADEQTKLVKKELVYQKEECNHQYDNDCDSECNLCKAIRNVQHLEVIDPRVNPTCKSSGLTEGSHCSKCNQIIVEQQTIQPLEHSWIEATKKAPKTCSICGLTEGEKLKGCKKTSLATILISISLYMGILLFRKRK